MSKEPPNFREVNHDNCIKCKWCDWLDEGFICLLHDNCPLSADLPSKWICDDFEGDEDE